MSGMPPLPDDVEATLVRKRKSSEPERKSEAERLIDRLMTLGWTIGVAESLTGGLLVSSLIDVPGASSVVRGGVVAYATDVKHSLLGVEATLLRSHGAVHPRVARQMAEGVRGALALDGERCDVGLSTTGIAGPESPDGQPVGTVHIGVSTPLGNRVEAVALTGSRNEIRAEAARWAIRVALGAL